MARRDGGTGEGRRACCLVSELLEESGLDRENVRKLRRQVLEGIVLLCRWQLERMDADRARRPAGAAARVRRRKIPVEQG
jgi:hypothetical protein